jgi:excisionase family DNA binding protein
MSEAARDPLAELARLPPTVLDEFALHELAARLQPLLPAGEALETSKRLHTATEAAELVGVNIDTVRRAIRSGQLGVAGRIGRSPRISRDAIDRWLTSTIELTDNGPRRRPRQLHSLTRCLPTAEDFRSPRATSKPLVPCTANAARGRRHRHRLIRRPSTARRVRRLWCQWTMLSG